MGDYDGNDDVGSNDGAAGINVMGLWGKCDEMQITMTMGATNKRR